MYYELALISVVVAGAYWGQFFLRKQPHGTATFGLMQLAAALLAGLGLYGHRTEDSAPWLGTAGAIGVGAGACLFVIAPFVRGLARRFAAAERLGIASRLLDVADLLAPGSGVADDKALLAAMKEIRDGHIEQTIDALAAARDRAPAEARLAIDERIAMLYLAAYRWDDAIRHAEEHLWRASYVLPPEPEGAPPSLRRALGVAPPVWVELLGAYGRTGDLDQAGRMLARLEDVCANRPDAAIWIHRARLMFLALAGRPAAVQALVDPRRARHMSPGARTYWLAVAHEHGGDREAAAAAYAKARGRSRGRPRELIDRALANLAHADGVPGVRLSEETSAIVARVEAAPLPAEVRVAAIHRPWATWTATATLLVVAGAIELLVGSTNDLGVLTRSGALVRGLVDGGEWWRIFSCVLVHVGGLHLLVNAIGVWFVGRIVEDLFGTARMLALFGACGLAGAGASYLASEAGISAGASGALFGLLGALFIELTWHRQHYRAAWKRGIWGGLAVVIVAQLGYGFMYPVIDQWAHGAGLAAGVVLGAVLSPHAPWMRVGRQLGRVLAVLALGLFSFAGIRVARTSIETSFQRLPKLRHAVGSISIVAPANWIGEAELADPDGLVIVSPHRQPLTDLPAQLGNWIGEVAPALAKMQGFERTEPALARVVALPDGWEGAELVASFTDPLGYTQRYRLIACGRVFGDELVTLVVQLPDTLARYSPRYIARLVSSVRAD